MVISADVYMPLPYTDLCIGRYRLRLLSYTVAFWCRFTGRDLICTSDANSKRRFTTSFLLEEGARKWCSGCALNVVTTWWVWIVGQIWAWEGKRARVLTKSKLKTLQQGQKNSLYVDELVLMYTDVTLRVSHRRPTDRRSCHTSFTGGPTWLTRTH